MRRWLLLGLMLGACGGDDEPPLGEWFPCDGAECLRIERPLPSGERITVQVARIRSGLPATKQLWLLQGGPGGTGTSLRPLALALHARGLTMDIYLPDHRGVGESTRLDCPDALARGGATPGEVYAACGAELAAAWQDDLAAFGTTSAADDLAAQIDAAGDGLPVIVWGGSYGTTWGHRYLQLHPDQPEGVVLDSICAGTTCRLHGFDGNLDTGARTILEACNADSACAARLGDAVAAAEELAADPTPCTGSDPRRWLAYAAMIAPSLLPPVVHRLRRCNAEDLTALETAEARLIASGDPGFSLALQLHIVLSELWPDTNPAPPTGDSIAGLGLSSAWIDTYAAWPRYPRPPIADRIADTTTPVLLLSGTWDWQTPVALSSEIAAALDGPMQTHAVIPYGSHGLLLRSPCATEMTFAFFADPNAAVDTGCTATATVPAFGDPALALELFGTSDAWD